MVTAEFLEVYVSVWGGFGAQVAFASVTVDVMVSVWPLMTVTLMLTTITVTKTLFS
tara:strand:- start:1181 stop:1348 length:168 start_codon:yes stop_codon:yes gene_type:complete